MERTGPVGYIFRGAFIVLLLAASCSGPEVKKGDAAQDLYNQANREMEGKKLLWLIPVRDYQAAIDGFKRVIELYPYSQWAVLAELRIADATFLKGEYLDAVNLYKEFQKKHPTNENIPYVIYRIGLSYMEYQNSLTIVGGIPYDRDLTAVENAIVEFTTVKELYPAGSYADAAKERLAICRSLVAKHDLYVGDFYFNEKAYQSAIPRYKRVVDEFNDSPQMEKALYHLSLSYMRIDDRDHARASLMRLIEIFPSGSYASEAKKDLAALTDAAGHDE